MPGEKIMLDERAGRPKLVVSRTGELGVGPARAGMSVAESEGYMRACWAGKTGEWVCGRVVGGRLGNWWDCSASSGLAVEGLVRMEAEGEPGCVVSADLGVWGARLEAERAACVAEV